MAELRTMTIDDYDAVYALWETSEGVAVSQDDTRENIAQFLRRNPDINLVAEEDGQIVGALMAGFDGYRGFIHHTCVKTEYRGRGIGGRLVEEVLRRMRDAGVRKAVLVVPASNRDGGRFWERRGFRVREDLEYRDLRLGGDLTLR